MLKEVVEGTSMAADDEAVLAASVPAEWVRDQLKAVGKSLRVEAAALKQLEDRIRALRAATQEYADACEKQEEESILPTMDKVKRAREGKLEQIKLVAEARVAFTRTEVATSTQITRLTALTPDWIEGVAKSGIDETAEPLTPRARAPKDTGRTKR